ncbi:nucleotidyltransferase domain-containing protein [Vulcanococcus sp.]|uniref:nucleotidyltransferase family protein n=1 Tax=Vulcanococcus sp. TaxID=2856995 RepID=UPI0025EE2FD5|nr:nucleotidyltransferase domain-containing protein [Vulcanococcus sp.]
MVSSPATRFLAPAIPWLEPQPLVDQLELGPGLDPSSLRKALIVLTRQPQVQALVAFGSRARGDARPDSDLDLAVICRAPSLTPAEKPNAALATASCSGMWAAVWIWWWWALKTRSISPDPAGM